MPQKDLIRLQTSLDPNQVYKPGHVVQQTIIKITKSTKPNKIVCPDNFNI